MIVFIRITGIGTISLLWALFWKEGHWFNTGWAKFWVCDCITPGTDLEFKVRLNHSQDHYDCV